MFVTLFFSYNTFSSVETNKNKNRKTLSLFFLSHSLSLCCLTHSLPYNQHFAFFVFHWNIMHDNKTSEESQNKYLYGRNCNIKPEIKSMNFWLFSRLIALLLSIVIVVFVLLAHFSSNIFFVYVPSFFNFSSSLQCCC